MFAIFCVHFIDVNDVEDNVRHQPPRQFDTVAK